jgi:hypothetical protein
MRYRKSGFRLRSAIPLERRIWKDVADEPGLVPREENYMIVWRKNERARVSERRNLLALLARMAKMIRKMGTLVSLDGHEHCPR